MFKHNFFTYGSQIIIKILLEIVYFPIWWYSSGLVELIKRLWHFLEQRERSLGFSIWLKNILVPMYGQNDIAGRIISFVIRLIQVIYRGVVLLILAVIALFILLFWILVPIMLLLVTLYQIGSFYEV